MSTAPNLREIEHVARQVQQNVARRVEIELCQEFRARRPDAANELCGGKEWVIRFV